MSLATATTEPASHGTFGDSYKKFAKMEESIEFVSELPYLAVTHEKPDTDALACLWFIDRFIANGNCEVRFVRSGERLPVHEGTGYNVIHADTGFGRFDQHGKKLERGSSFLLLAEHFGMANDPGIRPIVELTRATDNVENVDDCSVHNVFKSLRATIKNEKGDPDWEAIMAHAFVTLNCLHSFHTLRAQGIEEFEKSGTKIEHLKGAKLAVLFYKPRLRDAAFRKGADVVLWTVGKGKKGFYVGIQVNKQSQVKLGRVIVALRKAEAKRRNIAISEADSSAFGTLRELPSWFIHDSNKLIASGTEGHPLKDEEFTKLSAAEISQIVREAVSAI